MRQPITRASIGESSMFMGRDYHTGAGFALLGGANIIDILLAQRPLSQLRTTTL
jgi:hypothetical protein